MGKRGVVSEKAKKGGRNVPTTMQVNWKPLRMDFLWTWLGRLANPT